MYRTGDLGRWLPGMCLGIKDSERELTVPLGQELECLGRKDYQVKIHGHRIEIGEVEQAILRSGTVHDAVVILAEMNDKPKLVAFAIFKNHSDGESHEKNVSELKNGLNMLAPYMIPKIVVPLQAWVKLPSGKVDRKQLKRTAESMSLSDMAQYSINNAGQKHQVVAVSTDEERQLEEIWADIFGIELGEIGSAANFFSLGGDSISAINMVSACRKVGYEITVSQVLKFPILGDLAAKFTKKSPATDDVEVREFVAPKVALDEIERCGLNLDVDIDYSKNWIYSHANKC